MITPAEINEINKEFWRVESPKMEVRMKNPALAAAAMDRIRSDIRRGVPVYHQINLEAALEAAEHHARVMASEFGSRGGRPKKVDLLQEIINRIVTQNPDITCAALEAKLRDMKQPGGPIEDVDEDSLSFLDAKKRPHQVKLSRLKDRLTRARKKMREES
jgi:hypothetical protein